ncbi:RpiB/LacA/LacB family sugar-phosphate isomerase [Patescibacteria group bacterium]|nr:RpiB/LacA/LacB family sugar-phosphate isomerase [Patescibacteria group bacterium]MBU2036123.1 RpiB/LacA/LacB family sugar-phosphate isomerase [Patescibacteria group bacterium]
MSNKIYIGSDHRGFFLKEKVAKWLFEMKYDFLDLGALSLDPTDDYTKHAAEVASLVSNNKGSKGILLCGSGVGVDVVANKFDGVRSSIGKNPEQIKAGRADDDMNILVIAADFTKEKEAREMLRMFLETKFGNVKRHKKRLEEIEKIEANN